MSAPTSHSEMQDNATGVITRSHSRLRHGADASPGGDPGDRKHSPYLKLGRTARHAAKLARDAAKTDTTQDPPARHPEFENETPSTSRSSSLIDQDSHPVPASSAPQDGHAICQDAENFHHRAPSSARGTGPHIHLDDDEIIDVADSRTAQKRKRSTVDDDASSDAGIDAHNPSKKARFDGPSNDETVALGSSSVISITSTTATEALFSAYESPNPQSPTLCSYEAGWSAASPHSEGDSPECAQPVDEIPEYSAPGDASPTSEFTVQGFPEEGCRTSGDAQSVSSSFNEFEYLHSPSEPTHLQDEGCLDSTENSAQHATLVACDDLSKSDANELDAVDSAPFLPLSSASSNARPLAELPLSPTPRPLRYAGRDALLMRLHQPPSSLLAPNPVRGPARERRPGFRAYNYGQFLHWGVEAAAASAFLETRRQFPSWMTRPSRIYYKNGVWNNRGIPATEQDWANLAAEAAGAAGATEAAEDAEDTNATDVGVGMDVDGHTHPDGTLAPTAAPGGFLLPQNDLHPSESTYTTSQMVLDPDLDPSLMLNSNFSFSAHDPTADYFGPGADFTSSVGVLYQQPQEQLIWWPGAQYQRPQEQFWPTQDMSQQAQEQLWSTQDMSQGQEQLWSTQDMSQGPEQFPSGSIPYNSASTGSAPAFNQASGSGLLSGSVQWLPQHWDSSTDVDPRVYELFGPPPPSRFPYSSDSSLSPMAGYFAQLVDPIDRQVIPTTLSQPSLDVDPLMDGDGMDDGSEPSPSN